MGEPLEEETISIPESSEIDTQINNTEEKVPIENTENSEEQKSENVIIQESVEVEKIEESPVETPTEKSENENKEETVIEVPAEETKAPENDHPELLNAFVNEAGQYYNRAKYDQGNPEDEQTNPMFTFVNNLNNEGPKQEAPKTTFNPIKRLQNWYNNYTKEHKPEEVRARISLLALNASLFVASAFVVEPLAKWLDNIK